MAIVGALTLCVLLKTGSRGNDNTIYTCLYVSMVFEFVLLGTMLMALAYFLLNDDDSCEKVKDILTSSPFRPNYGLPHIIFFAIILFASGSTLAYMKENSAFYPNYTKSAAGIVTGYVIMYLLWFPWYRRGFQSIINMHS